MRSAECQVLQIPETCSEDSNEDEATPLRKTYILSPRKLKKTSGVSCRASVSELCNQAWEEGILTLQDLTTRSIRVGDSVLYDYVPQGIIRVDSQVTSCEGTQVRFGSQMVEEPLVLSQYQFELSTEEFIIREDGEMEARISRVSLATSCQVTQGSCVSTEDEIVISCVYTKPRLE